MTFNNLIQLVLPYLEITSMNPCVQVNGVKDIYDFRGYTTSHVGQFLHPSHLLFLTKMLQVCLIAHCLYLVLFILFIFNINMIYSVKCTQIYLESFSLERISISRI